MKQSKLYNPTSKDVTNQAVAQSHILALKAGLMHQTAAGIYSYLPLATKVLKNIETIIREELENIGANEVLLPLLEPSELWEKTGRWQSYGSELFRVSDRNGRQFALAPTHEEVMTELVKNQLNSYKKYPVNLFQIGPKMRDEARPRFGLLRGREFIMMDGYSYHTDEESLNETYMEYYDAYQRIFNRIGLNFKIVAADNGQMGGTLSHEFMALADIGEDTIVYEEANDIAYNIEVAPVFHQENVSSKVAKELSNISTPNIKKIEDLCASVDYEINDAIKAVVYMIDEERPVVCFVAGNHEVNDIKVLKALGGLTIEFASNEQLEAAGLVNGFVGPFGLPENVEVIFDQGVMNITDGICGANVVDEHTTGVNFARDLKATANVADIRFILEGEKMSVDGEEVKFARGIEIGHIFALGKKYTETLEVEYLTQEQKKATPTMGCYGIGVSRLLSAIIEQSHDENGIIFPESIAPFDVHVIAMDYVKKEEQRAFTDKLVADLEAAGLKVLLDDRKDRPGVKFSEADLIGLPNQIVVGRDFTEGIVEFKKRTDEQRVKVNASEVLTMIK